MEIVVTPHHHLHVREVGEGDPTTVLLHGWAVSGRLWDSVADRWPKGAGKLLIPDLRGTGWSSKPHSGYSLDDYTGDIVALLDHLTAQSVYRKLTLVGHSMGGAIAMQVALARPAALGQLILVSPTPPSGVPLTEGDLAYFRSLGGHAQGSEQLIKMMMAAPPVEPFMQRLLETTATVSREAFFGGLDAWRSADFADRLGAITVPTTVLGGEREQPLSPALLHDKVVRHIPGARWVLLPGVGHYPQIESPESFAAQLAELIASA